jgi:hypothetical protein
MSLQVSIVLIWEWHLSGILHLLLVLFEQGLVDGGGWGSEGRSGDEFLQYGQLCNSKRYEVNITKVGLPTSLRANHRKGFSKL